MRICSTVSIEVILNLTHLYIVAESIAKRTRRSVIGKELIKHTSQPPEGVETWDMPQGELTKNFNFVGKFTTKFTTNSEWDKDTIS